MNNGGYVEDLGNGHSVMVMVPELVDLEENLDAPIPKKFEQLAAELHLLCVHRDRLQAEMLDQLAQRIRPRHRVIVDFGNAGLVHRGRRIELARDDLAADAIGRFEDGDAALVAEFLLQIPGAHQTARPSAYD